MGNRPYRLGPWQVDPETGRLTRGDAEVALEPRLMALLNLLVNARGRVVARNAIEAALWPDVVVGEDTVARAVSRLRRALGDAPASPQFIETLPKRGYRLIAPLEPAATAAPPPGTPVRGLVAGAVLVLVLAAIALSLSARRDAAPAPQDAARVSRADDLYMRFTRADNEAAIGLYERVLADDPDNARAQAGLANALVQRVVRWPSRADAGSPGASTLSEAIDRGLTSSSEARAILQRAEAMAERAVRAAPEDASALKALALTVTAQGDLARAATLYERSIALDPDAWPSMINLGEIRSMQGDPRAAVAHYEQAYDAMARAYAYEPQRVGPWQVAMGVRIGEVHEQLEAPVEAELWYRRALSQAPFEPEATVRLARLLAASGDTTEAAALCDGLRERVGVYPGCPATP